MNYRLLPLAGLLLTALACGRPLTDPVTQPRLYPITEDTRVDESLTANAAMEATITPYREELANLLNRVVAEVATPLTKGQPESSLGNWAADLTLAAARELFPDKHVSFAVQNYGGLRVAEIGAGDLTVSQLYELMPFDNQLVLVEVNGQELLDFVDHTLSDGGWPVSEGLTAVRHDGTVTIRVEGRPVDPTATYYIAVPDYVANGGSDASMLAGRKQYASGQLVRDLLIEQAGRAPGPITVVSDGSRIKLNDR
ncbi:5'-nucleotidase C-terminal domain-containing protein [Lewinella sp. IMCC34183]|uniref:5'-nucleotidase C-terminal domain-containing protein n=1 Tax=Lewinella sp. IMCC34183 TaxID=2248762 RepID=UPI000E277D8C|nr:5'-nucleotidase C-terminal domain-containing protein [Lewinella sp. IMCC34183]